MSSERVGEQDPDFADALPMQRTALAVAAAWLVPGLGHVILGRRARGLIFGVPRFSIPSSIPKRLMHLLGQTFAH